jgi:hypothetical protein
MYRGSGPLPDTGTEGTAELCPPLRAAGLGGENDELA